MSMSASTAKVADYQTKNKYKFSKDYKYGSGIANHRINASERIWRLLEQFWSHEPSVGSEILRAYTESFMETECEPMAIRRAKALKKWAETVTAYIQPDELIVGVQDTRPRCAGLTPDDYTGHDWIKAGGIDNIDKRPIEPIACTDEVKADYRKYGEYWLGKKNLGEENMKELALVSPETSKLAALGTLSVPNTHWGHMSPDYRRICNKGIDGMVAEVRGYIDNLDMSDREYAKKKIFYDAVLITLEAFTIFAERYADQAAELAASETDKKQYGIYKKVEACCRNVAHKPAASFQEVLQVMQFMRILNDTEVGNCHGSLAATTFGRCDVLLWPYYKRDIDAGTLTKEEAQELIDMFYIKTAEPYALMPDYILFVFAGQPLGQHISVGGKDELGNDVTNDLTYMLIQGTYNTRLTQPTLDVFWHDGMPRELMKLAAGCSTLGTGNPSHYSYDTLVSNIEACGFSKEEARMGTYSGCVEPIGPIGKMCRPNNGLIGVSWPMIFAMRNGVHPSTGEQLSIQTGDPRSFATFEEFQNAVKAQSIYMDKCFKLGCSVLDDVIKGYPTPFVSALHDNCLESGKDLVDGGAAHYSGVGLMLIGGGTLIDSMLAIKKVIYEDKSLTWDQLFHALDTNFEDQTTSPTGNEIQQMVLNAPKYGNDIPEVNEYTVELMDLLAEAAEKASENAEHPMRPGLASASASIAVGLATPATPDGRKTNKPVSDACSPSQGREVNGPTAAVNSLNAFDHTLFPSCVQYNMKFSANTLKTESGLEKLTDLLRVYTKRGGAHVQINVENPEDLIAAQKNPEEYTGLQVRVAGYSAYFTEVDRIVQDDIISRVTFEF